MGTNRGAGHATAGDVPRKVKFPHHPNPPTEEVVAFRPIKFFLRILPCLPLLRRPLHFPAAHSFHSPAPRQWRCSPLGQFTGHPLLRPNQSGGKFPSASNSTRFAAN